MKHLWVVLSVVLAAQVQPVSAQDRIYRCGNEYTNNAAQAKERGCKLIEGGNVTVLQAGKPAQGAGQAASNTPAAAAPANAARVSAADQKARDSDARVILTEELRKAETRLSELRAEYNDGAPQKSALELRNPQGYIERTADLKARVERAQADVDGIRRELERVK